MTKDLTINLPALSDPHAYTRGWKQGAERACEMILMAIRDMPHDATRSEIAAAVVHGLRAYRGLSLEMDAPWTKR